MPKLSVLLPVHDARRHLAQAVESVLAQSFRDFELLLLDDGSRDGSRTLLERYATGDPRALLHRLPHRGLVATLNEGLARAAAPLVARMDADDVALPRRFELQVAFLDAHPEVICVGGGYERIDARGRTLQRFDALPVEDAEIQERLLAGDTVLCHPTVVMRREAVLAAGGYDPDAILAEDLDLYLRLGERGSLALVPEVVLRYREHPASLSMRRHPAQLAAMRRVCTRAWQRRGIQGRFENTGWLPTSRREAHDFMIRYGWLGFARGDRRMLFDYALQAIRFAPLHSGGWRLLAKACRPGACHAGPGSGG